MLIGIVGAIMLVCGLSGAWPELQLYRSWQDKLAHWPHTRGTVTGHGEKEQGRHVVFVTFSVENKPVSIRVVRDGRGIYNGNSVDVAYNPTQPAEAVSADMNPASGGAWVSVTAGLLMILGSFGRKTTG